LLLFAKDAQSAGAGFAHGLVDAVGLQQAAVADADFLGNMAVPPIGGQAVAGGRKVRVSVRTRKSPPGVGPGGLGEISCSCSNGGHTTPMTVAIRAIYEGGKLRPLEPLELAENAVVQISVETGQDDAVRREWLDQGKRSLMGVWNNKADDVYNVLLSQ
jgi:predicted DNA-binding antitoxin AbrB/MazE fold protein